MYWFYLVTALLLFSLPFPVSAASAQFGLWQASGFQEWRTSFPLSSGSAPGASELYYPQSGTYLTGSYETALKHRHFWRIDGGLLVRKTSGTGSDSDWDFNQGNSLWWYGEFKSAANSAFLNIDYVSRKSPAWETFWGYGYRSNRFTMTDGIYYIENYAAPSPYPDNLAGLNSTYQMVYHGPHAGLRYQMPVLPHLAMISSLTYSPLAFIRGEGWWNLRQMRFVHNGIGQMLDASVGLAYNFSAQAGVSLGYRYQYSSLYHGWENTSDAISWNKATNIQRGPYFIFKTSI